MYLLLTSLPVVNKRNFFCSSNGKDINTDQKSLYNKTESQICQSHLVPSYSSNKLSFHTWVTGWWEQSGHHLLHYCIWLLQPVYRYSLSGMQICLIMQINSGVLSSNTSKWKLQLPNIQKIAYWITWSSGRYSSYSVTFRNSWRSRVGEPQTNISTSSGLSI